MFERFTREARAMAVVDAQQVARDTRSGNIDTRHLLLALAEHPGPVSGALPEAGAYVEALTARCPVRPARDRHGIEALARIASTQTPYVAKQMRSSAQAHWGGHLEQAARSGLQLALPELVHVG